MGSRSHENGRCLAHLAADELATTLAGIGSNGRVDARGVEVSRTLLEAILRALPRTPGDNPRFEQADFRGATFKKDAVFSGATFKEDAWFNNAIFEGDAWFDKAIFEHAWFYGVIFEGEGGFEAATFRDAFFYGATFKGEARFHEAIFKGDAAFAEGMTFEQDASFRRAIFKGESWFTDEMTFEGEADFEDAIFEGEARFDEAVFKRDASFYGAIYREEAWFREAIFERNAGFEEATFKRDANFHGATFDGEEARFQGATFEWSAYFTRATFGSDAQFNTATFEGDAWFHGAIFKRDAWFHEAIFNQDAGFDGATFARARQFGPTLVLGTLSLEGASFLQAAECDISARRLLLGQASFPAGINIRIRWAEVILEEASFGAPSILAGSPRFSARFKERKLVRALTRDGVRSRRSGRPRILSPRRANVSNLLLSDIDLRPCLFAKTHNLDGLRLEGDVEFARPPKGLRWAQRRVLAEEHQWRYHHQKGRSRQGWYGEEVTPPSWFLEMHPEVREPLDAYLVATIYRDLRKGREDNKDEPGAADFYYGEMEMRRFDKTKPRAERLILWLYWLVSGYGLRASRALLSLAVTILVFAALLYAWGFPSQQSFLEGVTFSAQSTTSLFRAPDRKLTLAGDWLQIGLRLLGPLFFGLALLSLRGRVKR